MNESVKELMDQLAVELKRQKKNDVKIESLHKKLDKLLGTELKAEDNDGADEWERGRR